MIVGHVNDLIAKASTDPAAKGAAMKVLVSPEEGWEDYVMRVVEVEVNGHSPKHTHDWPHINYIIEGEGTLQIDDKINPIKAGSYAYVPSNALHEFVNTSDTPLKFICIVPKEGHQ